MPGRVVIVGDESAQSDFDLGELARPGHVLLGKYRIERVLGAGGMGAVVLAMHLQLEERVAIKFLLSSVARQPDMVERFLREGRAAIKIRSEHCVRVLDVGTLEGGPPYMVMEYLEGRDLEATIRERARSRSSRRSTSCSRRARRSPRRTRSASCTATSSPRTSS